MTAFDRKWRPCGGIETFERLQHGERDDALAIWRTFPNLVTAVAGSDRCHVFRRIGKKILQRVAAAGGAQRIDRVARDPAFVEGCRSIAGDAAQRGGERRLAMDIARPRGRAVRQKMLAAVSFLRNL